MFCGDCKYDPLNCDTYKVTGHKMAGCSEGKLVDIENNNIPTGYYEIKNVDGVFVSNKEIVVTGMPNEDDDDHDCDVMGCSSISHVLFRANL